MKVKMQVALHRKDHDGSVIVRLEPVEDTSIPAAQRVVFEHAVEVRAHSEEILAAFKAPTEEEHEVFIKPNVTDRNGNSIVDRRVKTPAAPGSTVYVEITPA